MLATLHKQHIDVTMKLKECQEKADKIGGIVLLKPLNINMKLPLRFGALL